MSKNITTLNIDIDDNFRDLVSLNLININNVLAEREDLSIYCQDLLSHPHFSSINNDEIWQIGQTLTQGISNAQAQLQALCAFLNKNMEIQSNLKTPEHSQFGNYNQMEKKDLIPYLKSLMYMTHSKEKRAIKDAKEIFKTRELLKRANNDDELESAYTSSLNFKYLVAINDIFAKTGAYRTMIESMALGLKQSLKEDNLIK